MINIGLDCRNLKQGNKVAYMMHHRFILVSGRREKYKITPARPVETVQPVAISSSQGTTS